MKFNPEMQKVITSLGLAVGGKAGSAIVHPVHGFEGRRLYIDAAPPFVEWEGATIHLSGFTPDEAQMLGAVPNERVKAKDGSNKYFASSRISGFLKLTEQNLKDAAAVLRDATDPAWSRGGNERGETESAAASVFAALAQSK